MTREITLPGNDNATYASKAWCTAKVMEGSNGAPSYSYAAIGVASSRLGCWLLDGSTLEGAAGWIALPDNWTSIDVYARWAVPTADSGDCVWQLQYQMLGAGTEVAAETTDSQVTATAAAQNVLVDTQVKAALDTTGFDTFKFDLLRRGDVAADTLDAVDVGLVGVYITEAA